MQTHCLFVRNEVNGSEKKRRIFYYNELTAHGVLITM